MADILLNHDKGYWDLNLINGDFESTTGFETAIYISLLCERRASAGEVARIEQRRGWSGNLVWNNSGLEMGSKLWLLLQTRNDSLLPNIIKNYAEEALLWLVYDGYAKSVDVSVTSINSRSIQLNISIVLINDELITSNYEVSR